MVKGGLFYIKKGMDIISNLIIIIPYLLGVRISKEDVIEGSIIEDKIKDAVLEERFWEEFMEEKSCIRLNVNVKQEIIDNLILELLEVVNGIVNEILDLETGKIDNFQIHIGEAIKDFSNKRLLDRFREIEGILVSNIARLSIIMALNKVYKSLYLLKEYYVELDRSILLKSRPSSIYYYFCYDYGEQKMLLSSEFIKSFTIIKEFSEKDPIFFSKFLNKLESDWRVGNEEFMETSKILGGRIHNKEILKNLNNCIFPFLFYPLNNMKSDITYEDLENVIKIMLCNMGLLEVEIFRRIVNIGFPAVPRVSFYKETNSGRNEKVGEIDVLILNPEKYYDDENELLLLEITTRQTLNDKVRKVRNIIDELKGNININISELFICEEEVEGVNSLSFSDVEDKLELKLYESFCSCRNSSR